MPLVTPVAGDVAIKTVPPNIVLINGTGGETITAGQWVYLKAADQEYYLADNNVTAAEAEVAGIAIQPSADGEGITICGQEGNVVTLGVALTEDTWYTISDTAGSIEPVADSTSGDYRSWVGYGNKDGDLAIYIINTGLVKT